MCLAEFDIRNQFVCLRVAVALHVIETHWGSGDQSLSYRFCHHVVTLNESYVLAFRLLYLLNKKDWIRCSLGFFQFEYKMLLCGYR